MANNINFGVIDILVGDGYCSDEQTQQVIEILKKEPAVINYETYEHNSIKVISIDQYDNITIGNVLNKIARI